MARALDKFAFALIAIAGCASDKPSREVGIWNQDMSDPATFHRAMGRTYIAQKNWGQATAHLRESLRHDSDAGTHVLLGIVLREQGLNQSAEASLLTAIDLDDEMPEAHSALGVLYDRLGKHKDADRLHRKALELDPERADLHNNLGFSLYLRGQWEEAVSAYQASLRLGAGPRVHNNLGFTYGHMRQYSKAFREFQRGGTEAEAHNNVGFAYEAAGDLPLAEKSYLQAIRLDPKLTRARDNLEHVAHKLGHAVPNLPGPTGVGVAEAPAVANTPKEAPP